MDSYARGSYHEIGCILPVFLSSIFLWTTPISALDPSKRVTQYDIRLYQAEHGLPMNDMKVVFQDSKGYLWLGCQEGLVRFDGVRFVLFDKSKYPELGENFIWDIKEDWEGNLWLATNGGGVSRFDGKSFTTFDTSDGLASNIVQHIVTARDHTIWFGTENGLTRFKDGVFTTMQLGGLPHTQSIYALLEDDYGSLLIGRRHTGLEVLMSDSLHTFPTKNGTVNMLCKKASGEVIVKTEGPDFYVYHRGRIDEFHLPLPPSLDKNIPSHQKVRNILEDNDGNFWFCTDGDGIVRYHNGRFEHLKAENGFPKGQDFFVRAIEDREKNLWFVGDGGLLQLKDNKFMAFGRNEGFKTNFGNTVCQDHEGYMWAGLRRGGLVRFDKYTNVTSIPEYDERLATAVLAIIPSQRGGLWIGSYIGLSHMKDGQIHKYTTVNRFEKQLGSRIAISLFENGRGELWIGCMEGFLTKFDGKTFNVRRLFEDHTEASGGVVCVIERANSEVWAGTWKQGLYRLSGTSIARLTLKDGFDADGANALYEDDEQVLWIATDGQGLYRHKDGKFKHFTSRNGLAFDRLFSILEDDNKNLWFSGNRGIFRASKQQLNEFADGKADTIICQRYNYLDGMRETECNGRRQPVAWRSRDGRLWFVSLAGVVCVDPNNMVMNDRIPPVLIEEIMVNRQHTLMPDASMIPLKANERDLTIRYTALSLVIPERVRFQYKLEGYDNNWIDAGTRRTAFYTNLPKGNYTFRVLACNNDGKWNIEGATVQFSIAPFWWETWWAYLLYASALVMAFLGLRQYELKRARLRNELKLEHVRTERLQELDHLKSRFFAGISHEFRTPLTLIREPLQEMLAETDDPERKSKIALTLRNTDRLQRLVDQLLDLAQLESGKMTLQARPVRPVGFLQNIVAALESYAQQRSIQLDFHAHDQLETETIYLDPDKMEKVVINLLFNALKYTSSGGKVEVVVGRAAPATECLEIRVRDTGRGIPESALPHIFDYFYRYRDENTRRESGTGIGLALTKEFVVLHHGEISVTSTEGVGSEFVIRLPLGTAHLKPEEIVTTDLWEGEAASFDLTKWAAFKNAGGELPLPAAAPIDHEEQADAPKILLVEDNPDMLSYLRGHLQRDYHLLEATDGVQGLQKALDEIPDLIVSDVMMPGKDGFELCRELKTNELTSHIPVLLLTARGSGESKMMGLELGADDYLTKPISGRELRLRVRNQIERQRKLRDHFRAELASLDLKLPSLPAASMDEKFIQRALAVVGEHLADPDFGPQQFARCMAMSRVHLNRKLRGLLGLRTSEFIRGIRLKRAAELLRQQGGTVSQIAYEVGFNHLSYFARCFKEQYGQLPSEFAPQ